MQFREKNTKVLNVPFNSKDKIACSVHESFDKRDGDRLWLVLKGKQQLNERNKKDRKKEKKKKERKKWKSN